MVGFNEIIGHEEIIRHLKNAMKTGIRKEASGFHICHDASVRGGGNRAMSEMRFL